MSTPRTRIFAASGLIEVMEMEEKVNEWQRTHPMIHVLERIQSISSCPFSAMISIWYTTTPGIRNENESLPTPP